ncbi:MAG: DNA-protecting protein DprA [Candidatus Omnitrophota bacterium]|nr:MAG: DNA-protecting protein DprA [Candidatus Omnitrophota bacterium]
MRKRCWHLLRRIVNRREALIGLNLIGSIGTARLKRLLEIFVCPQEILASSADALTRVSGIGHAIASKITSLKEEGIAAEIKLAKERGLSILTYEDEGYPLNLKNIFDPPIVLYVKGQIRDDDSRSIAVVGSRRASCYGLTSAERLSGELARLGITVISGMARGIDTFAHKGALKAGGRTLAVMGSGFAHLYPAENKKLAEEISHAGAVISEFPLTALPLKQNFPRRNRLISGLAKGVVVVEAARNSGALITADFALEQGREVFALPGAIDSSLSYGTNELIKQGSRLVTSVNDIIEELFGSLLGEQFAPRPLRQCAQEKQMLSKEESFLYNLISDTPLEMDEIIEKSHMDIATAAGVLLRLEIKNLVQQLPGKQFVRG